MSKAISRRDFLKVTGAVGAAGLLAACGGNGGAASSTASSAAEAASVAGLSSDPVTLTMSWWGGESRHNAYQEALKAFSAEHTTITVNPTFAAWSGWEDTMSTKFAGGVAEDVCQINWNWLYNYSGNGQTFLDLNSVTDYLDMSQWDDAKLGACNVANAQQCVPISMTGRIFYWNMTTFAAWSGWEDTMSTKFAGGVAEDVCQINWNWLYNYSGNGQTFLDLNSVTDYLDMSQWDDAKLGACNVANAQQCVPISMTGRIFYWNMTTFNKAGITEVPATEDDLFAAGKAFQEKLGDDYYPLHLGAYDRMILMVFYLESKYGKDWADPTTSTLNYTADEIAEGIDFIKSLVDGHVIMPLPTYYGANGDGATHQSNEWITGKIAGIFEWDSAASKYQDALDEENKPGFTVGEEIKFGDYNGGFSKVSMGMAITKTCKNPAEAATLIEYLWNGDGAAIMGSECGIPASKAGLATAQAAGKINELVAEANGKVMSFVSCQLDPLFESSDLKATGTGTYQEVFDTVDYDNKSGADVVDVLLDGMSAVGYTV